MIKEPEVQTRLEEFQTAVSNFQRSVGSVGGSSDASSEIPDTAAFQERLYEALTTAAIKGQIRFSSATESQIVNKVLRIEHQSYLRGEAPDESRVVLNLMDYDSVELI